MSKLLALLAVFGICYSSKDFGFNTINYDDFPFPSLPHLPNITNETGNDALRFIECIVKEVKIGLDDSFKLPPNPLVVQKDFSFDVDVPVVGKVKVRLPLIQVDGIQNYTISQLNGSVDKENGVIKKAIYNIGVIFKEITLSGTWIMEKTVLLIKTKKVGDFVIRIQDLAIAMFWNMILPGKAEVGKLQDAEVGLKAGNVKVDMTNSPFPGIAEALTKILNKNEDQGGDNFLGTVVSPVIKSTLNDLWSKNAEKIDSVIKQC